MRFHVLPAVLLCALPAASFGLTASMGLEFEDGSTSLIMAPGPLAPVGVTTTVRSDGPLFGFQYAILATYDPDGPGGPSPAVNANDQFQFLSIVSLSGKGAMPFAGSTRLHDQNDNGVFDSTGFDSNYFQRAEYTPGFGPFCTHHPSTVPISLGDAYPEVVAIVGSTNVGPANGWDSKVATYEIASVGSLSPGTYTLTVGDKDLLGYYVCQVGSPGCIVPGVHSTVTITVPEPASVVLMLAVMVPLARRSSFARRRALT